MTKTMSNATVLPWLLFLCVAALPSALLSDLVDTDGDLLRNGGAYEILTHGGDQGIAPRPGFLGGCPVGIFQYPRGLSSEPVIISSPARILFLHSGLPLNIAFTKLPASAALCTNSTEWQLVKTRDDDPENVLVGFEEADQFPGTVLNGFFRIQSSEEHPAGYYYILFSERGSSHFRAIGGRLDPYYRTLRLVAVDENPLAVKFVKVPETAAGDEKEEHLKMVV